MKHIKTVEFPNDVAVEIAEIRAIAADAEPELRTLRDLEMGWVAGGDDVPVWVPH
ncbi:MAG TPA: hypothetical protein VHQ02_01345 [Usitatibacter sp.]|jgi:hypothetical protein|nr:hypothetical protein [Usitatibacter sp.]